MRRESKFSRAVSALAQHCRHRNASDEGDSVIITSMLILPLFFFLIISAIDMGLYFNSQAIIERTAQDAARTSVLYGGAGSRENHSEREEQYGTPVTSEQISQLSNSTGVTVRNSVEYRLVNDLLDAETAMVELDAVSCSPNRLNSIGEVAYCDVSWAYQGLPASVWGLMMTDTEPQLSTGNAQSQNTHYEVSTVPRA